MRKLIRIPGICAASGGGRSKLYSEQKEGLWPPFVKPSDGIAGLFDDEIELIQNAIAAGADKAQRREVVKFIVAQRKAAMPKVAA